MRPLLALLLLVLALPAAAAGRMCTTRDVLVFGDVATGTRVQQGVTVSNCGTDSWSFTDVSAHPATAAAFGIATTCATGRTLVPGESCAIDVTFAPLAAGQMSGGLWLHNTTSTPDQIVTFYGRGVDVRAGSATLEFSPAPLSFEAQVVGKTSAPRTLALRNRGPGTLTLSALVLNGPAAYDFRSPGTCVLGVPMPAGGACELYVTFTPAAAGTRLARLNVDAPELASLALLDIGGTGVVAAAPATPTVDVVEFVNAPLAHWFLTAVPEEAAAIDAGVVGPEWQRTGYTFRAYASDGTAGQPVCRFFGTPGVGPSAHFFTADTAECAQVKADPHWRYEGIAFRALLPAAGACPPGTDAVVRFFRPGADVLQSRHRYVRDAAERARMRDGAWIEEGPVFCSPA